MLRDQRYAEMIAAAGNYNITEDRTFILTTEYKRAAAEEKIWFVNPNLRCLVSLIKTTNSTYWRGYCFFLFRNSLFESR